MSATPALCALPISARPSPSRYRSFIGPIFGIIFVFGNVMVNTFQFIFLLPLRLLPFNWSRSLYVEGIRYTKGAYGCLLVLMSQWFAPTQLYITFETEGSGAFTQEQIDEIVHRDASGHVTYLDLPKKFIYIANHQVYADWWYAWCFLYFLGPQGTNVHRYIYITLKNSLRWVPVIGWGMQFFNFIFLARSWAHDRLELARQLSKLGKEASTEDIPFAFIIYPEGTLVSGDTRPISKKFADKMGILDMTNILLPRSTGLHYSLRALSPRIPDLHLLDVTMVYPGIPPMGYGQDYYTLRSMFFQGVPPPAVHMHLRLFNVAHDIPIGDMSSSNSTLPENSAIEVDVPESEKTEFDSWLRALWCEKDASISQIHVTQSFSPNIAMKPVAIPLELRTTREMFDAFCFFLPAAAGYIWRKMNM